MAAQNPPARNSRSQSDRTTKLRYTFCRMNASTIDVASKLLSLLPLALNQSVGTLLARAAWLGNSRARRITEFNIRHCFPDMPANEQAKLSYESLKHTGRQLAECAWIWNRPASQTQQLIRETRGEQLLKDALDSLEGVIVVSPHIGNWELCALPLSALAPFTYFYRSPRNEALDPLLLKWRAHLGGQPASLDAGGIREGLKIIKKGGMVGILPDQEPDPDNGVYAPFFNQPALTMTLLPRLAARSGAHVIYMVSERLPDAQGWRIHYLPADPTITDDNPEVAAAAVNRDVERCIQLCPAQYLWDYKRFNTLSDGTRRRY